MEECIAKLLKSSSSDRQNLSHILNDYFHDSDETEDSASDSDSNDSCTCTDNDNVNMPTSDCECSAPSLAHCILWRRVIS